MLGFFAAADPQTVLSSGNTVAILALIIVTLSGVIVYLVRKADTKDTEIRDLNRLLLAENKSHTADYKEMAKDNQEILQGNSQSSMLLAAKIEAVKGREL
jgi:hypothetical protein